MKRIIIWSDNPDACVPLAAQLRAGPPKRTVLIRDGRFFHVGGVERCDALMFIDTHNADAVIAGYRAAERSIGRVALLGEVVGAGDLSELDAPSEPLPQPAMVATAFLTEDLLSERLAAMSDDALRTYVRGVTGVDPGEDATREAMEATLRGGAAPAPKAEETEEQPPAAGQTEEQAEPKRGRKGKAAAASEG